MAGRRFAFVVCAMELLVINVSAVLFDNNEGDVEGFIQEALNCWQVPGMAITVVEGQSTWSRGFGKANLEDNKDVDSATLFNIGSMTKSFTMNLIGILLTEQNLTWSTKIIDILGPAYRFVDDYRTRELTLKDVLSHRTGLAALHLDLLAGVPHNISRDEFARKVRYLPEQAPFRDMFIYNNYMYMLLGHVTEKLGGDTWENLLTSKLLEPLGMTATKVLGHPDELLTPGVARPYIFKKDKFINGTAGLYRFHPIEPAVGIMSSADDMAKYIRYILKLDKTDNGKQLVDESLMRQTFIGVITTADPGFPEHNFIRRPFFPVSETPMGYGLAWRLFTYRGYKVYSQSGRMFSFSSVLWIFPDLHAGIFACANGSGLKYLSSDILSAILYHVSDILLGFEPWLDINNTCQYPMRKPRIDIQDFDSIFSLNAQSLHDFREYTGTYGSEFVPNFIYLGLEVNDNTTNLVITLGRFGGKMFPANDNDSFYIVITWPDEIRESFTYNNNLTIPILSRFYRKNSVVDYLEIDGAVNVRYKKILTSDNEENQSVSGNTTINAQNILHSYGERLSTKFGILHILTLCTINCIWKNKI